MLDFKTLAVSLAATTVLAGAAVAQERSVNVYNWSDYIDEEIITDFENETGIDVTYDVFDSNEVLETKLLAGSTGYDVVVPTGSFLARQIQAGVFQPLDKSKLTNLENMDDAIEERLAVYDPDNTHAVNYMWGTTGIGYNKAAVQERLGTDEITSWDVIFDPEELAKFQNCGVHFLDAPTEMVPAALNYLGIDPNAKDAESTQKAGELLKSVRENVQKFHSSEYINALANGDICLAVGWSGDVFQARDRAEEADNGVEIGFSIPDEGAVMWFDNMAIPADAENVEEAHEFINYMMRPDVIAKATNYVYYANGNAASTELLEEDITSDPGIYPPEDVMAKLFTITPYGPREQRTLTRTWTEVKTGQ